MRGILLIAAIGLVIVVLLVQWIQGEVDNFAARCHAKNGTVHTFSNQMSGYACLTSDGRIIKIEGPGL